jgi:hypothetical protein
MMTQHLRRLSAFAPSSSIVSTLAFSLLGVLAIAAPDTGHALSCLQDRMGDPVNCTANDVRITDVTDIVVTDDGCAAPGDTVTFNATLVVVTTATQRYDIGLFVGVDGVQALSGDCRVRTLPTSPPPFYNFDNDACGDTSSAGIINLPVKNLTVNCVDLNGDKQLDFANCTSWRQNDNFTCNGPANVVAGTPAKCNCPEIPLDIDVPVPEPICTSQSCNDGLFCNGLETCDPNVGCQPGTPPACGDAFACTADACNEATDSCTHAPNNGLCSDGQFCNGVEVCSPTQGCVAGTPPACGDAFGCTADACNEATDSCVHTPNNSICNDGLFCNGTETCSATLGCRPGTAPNCGDAVACTLDTCNEATDSCRNTAMNSLCTDGLFCNGLETCSATQGCQAGTPPNCSDPHACTIDACNEASDSCTHTPNNGVCSDGQFCNGAEICSAQNGCQAGTAPNCADSAACTQDACNEATDSCTHTPNNAACSDGQFCNGAEICTANGCQAGSAPNCGDSVACTVDACNESTDSCTHAPTNSLCNDSQFCNGVETCDATLGCQAGTGPNCSDNVPCTVDACNEATDSCTHAANNGLCDNGLFCDGTEICNALAGCQNGSPPNCVDSVPCTNDVCNEELNRCDHDPDNSFCADQSICTNDICDPTLGCTHVNNTAPCNDGNACTGNDTCQNGICIPRGDVCGDGIVDANCGEQCDPGTSEICNNGIDDDGDTLIDCGDPNCAETQLPGCSAQCLPIPPCTPILNDPAIIYMPELDVDADGASRSAESAPMGRFQFHGRIQPFTDVDPITDGFVLTLTNANGEIWRAEVLPGDIQQTARNRYAINATIGATATSSGGIAKLNVRKRRDEGILGYGIRVRAYGDFSRATLPEMTTQVYFNDDVGFVTARWAKRPGRWTLFARHLDDQFVD